MARESERWTEKDVALRKDLRTRKKWDIGSEVDVYSHSLERWFLGEVVNIKNERGKEWLIVEYGQDNLPKVRTKHVERAAPDVVPKVAEGSYVQFKVENEGEQYEGIITEIHYAEGWMNINYAVERRRRNGKIKGRKFKDFQMTFHQSHSWIKPAVVGRKQVRRMSNPKEPEALSLEEKVSQLEAQLKAKEAALLELRQELESERASKSTMEEKSDVPIHDDEKAHQEHRCKRRNSVELSLSTPRHDPTSAAAPPSAAALAQDPLPAPAPARAPLPGTAVPVLAPLPGSTSAPMPGLSAPAPLPGGGASVSPAAPQIHQQRKRRGSVDSSTKPTGAPLPGRVPTAKPLSAPAPASAPLPGSAPLPSGAAPAPISQQTAPAPIPGQTAPAPMPGQAAPALMPGQVAPAPMPPLSGGAAAAPCPMPGGIGAFAPPLLLDSAVPPPLSGISGLNGGKKKTKKYKLLQWKKIKGAELAQTIFNDIKIDDEKDEIKLDYKLLDELWIEPKKPKKAKKTKKKDPNAKPKPKVRKLIEFLGEMDDKGKVGRAVKMCLSAKKKMIETAEGWRDLMYTMEIDEKMGDPAEIIEALITLSPSEENLEKFDENWKTEKYKLIDVKYFDIGERLWYYCRQIPLPKIRNSLWKFKLEFDERCQDQYKLIRLIRETRESILGSQKMKDILRIILHIGNRLNNGHKRIGSARGVHLDIFDTLRGAYANKPTSKEEQDLGGSIVRDMGTDQYSLLMFIRRMVEQHYPALADWTDIFEPCTRLYAINLAELERDVGNIKKDVDELGMQLERMKTEKERLAKEKQICNASEEKKSDADLDEVWEPPPAPKDVYIETMELFLNEAMEKADRLLTEFNETKVDCLGLVSKMGEKFIKKKDSQNKDTDEVSIGETMENLWYVFKKIKEYWEEAEKNRKKAAETLAKRNRPRRRSRVRKSSSCALSLAGTDFEKDIGRVMDDCKQQIGLNETDETDGTHTVEMDVTDRGSSEENDPANDMSPKTAFRQGAKKRRNSMTDDTGLWTG